MSQKNIVAIIHYRIFKLSIDVGSYLITLGRKRVNSPIITKVFTRTTIRSFVHNEVILERRL